MSLWITLWTNLWISDVPTFPRRDEQVPLGNVGKMSHRKAGTSERRVGNGMDQGKRAKPKQSGTSGERRVDPPFRRSPPYRGERRRGRWTTTVREASARKGAHDHHHREGGPAMTDPNDIVERLRRTLKKASWFAGGPPYYVVIDDSKALAEAADEIVRLLRLVAELTPPQWADDTPVLEADAADEAHARLQAIADSHETLEVKWGVQYAEMIRNGREGRS